MGQTIENGLFGGDLPSKARFDMLVKVEKSAKTDKSPSTPAEGHVAIGDAPEQAVVEPIAAVHPDEFSAGIRPGRKQQ